MNSSQIEKINAMNWDFEKSDTTYLTHDLHIYQAKFIPQIPRNLILLFTKENDTVLDPFCGSGTTLVEASLNFRNAIGNDLNPIATLIAKVKTTPINQENWIICDKAIDKIKREINSIYVNPLPIFKRNWDEFIPEFHNREKWFEKHVQRELAIIKYFIEDITIPSIKDFLRLCFSSIIVRASNQDSESRYTVNKEKKVERKKVLKLFLTKVEKNKKKIIDFSNKARSAKIEIYNKNSKSLDFLDNDTIDFVVTSPPYLNSWDYNLYHRFRLFWLDMNVQAFRREEIGAHLKHTYNEKSYIWYRNDMTKCISEMYRVLKQGKYFSIVIGNSKVKGKIIDTPQMLEEIGIKVGFSHCTTINRNIDLKSKSFNTKITRLKQEKIIIFRK